MPDDATPGEGGEPPSRVHALRLHAERAAVLLGVAVVTFALFPAAPVADLALLEPGAVAPDNVIAPFAFTVRKSVRELAEERADLAKTVEPIFTYEPAALDTARALLDRLAAAIAAAAAAGGGTAALASLQRAALDAGVRLTPAEANYLLLPGRGTSVLDAVWRAESRWAAAGVAASGALDEIGGAVTIRRGADRSVPSDGVPTFAAFAARARTLRPDAGLPTADAVFDKVLAGVFRPTLVFDRAATERARQELARSVRADKYTVLPGEKIVGAHEVVGRAAHEKMRQLRDELAARGTASGASRVFGAMLFNALVLMVFGTALWCFAPELYASRRAVLVFAVLFMGVGAAAAAIARTSAAAHPELIPIALAAFLSAVLFDARIALVATTVLAALIGGQNEFRGTNALFVSFIGGAAAALSVRAIRRRTDALRSIAAVALAYVITALAIGLALDRSATEILHSAAWGALNAGVSVAVAMLLLPAAEAFARVDTYFTLLEWSDLNRPLLRRLSLEAPGTFAHTIAIANLAESACDAIGANALLARVGAYYHDIGKLATPQYFGENQARGRNPHDALPPSASAAIIREHVRAGLALAEQHGVPRAIRAFIAEHHGTGRIAYFAEKARQHEGAAPTAAEYEYPGPLPRTAETAVCMLADGVEAAARVLSDPSPAAFREVIDRIVTQRMEQGQLRDAPLTLRQLATVKEQFLRSLLGMYHSRVDYPASVGGITASLARA